MKAIAAKGRPSDIFPEERYTKASHDVSINGSKARTKTSILNISTS